MRLETPDLALGFGIALGVGALVGLERERAAIADRRPLFGGIRTFPLIALLGGLSALLSEKLGPLGFVLPFLACSGLVALAYVKEGVGAPGEPGLGLTTEFAALLVFAIGALPFVDVGGIAFKDRLVLAGALGAVVMAALALRDPLHRMVNNVNRDDVVATVRFVLLAAVMLPLLPDRAWDPWEALNPRRIGLFVVLIAGVSFFGYVAVRALGAQRGIGLTAVSGGLVSSTAVTLSFSGRAKTQPGLARLCSLAIVLACTIMFPRVMLLVGVVRGDLLVAALPALGAMLGTCAIGCAVLWLRLGRDTGSRPLASDEEHAPQLENPFSLRQALKLGVVFALVRLVVAVANDAFGSSGLLVSAGLAGLVDVDPIVISVTRMFANQTVSQGNAVLALALAAMTNNVVKTGLVFAIAGRRAGILVGSVLVPATVAGILAALLW